MVAALAALKAVGATRDIAQKQLDLQERQLRKDLYDRRFAVYRQTAEFLRPILGSPSSFRVESDESRKFAEAVQDAGMLFGADVCRYLKDVNTTAVDLWASYSRMQQHPGDNNAIEESGRHFQHLKDLWDKRSNVFRPEMSLQ